MKIIQSSILKRALGDKEFNDVIEQYKNARYTQRANTQPSANHIRLAALGKKHGATIASKKAGASPAAVNYAMSRVARYEWLNKN